MHLPRKLMDMLQSAACCRVADRWAFLYRVVWRWQHGEQEVLSAADEDGSRLHAMVKAVHREEHDMHAYIRFRERPEAAGAPRFVHIVDDVPELAETAGGPVLVTALDGFLDAGNAGGLAVRHLLAGDQGRVVASFDIDAFYDYRARRPPMTFSESRYEDYEPPRLVVRLNHDSLGTPYLLLHGPEPDTRWEGFATAVREVVEHFDVRLTVTDIHRRHGVIVLTDQYGTTWTYPATGVIPTAVPDPLHLRTSTIADGGTR